MAATASRPPRQQVADALEAFVKQDYLRRVSHELERFHDDGTIAEAAAAQPSKRDGLPVSAPSSLTSV